MSEAHLHPSGFEALLPWAQCAVQRCEGGFLPDLFERHDHPCPGYAQEALVSPFDLPLCESSPIYDLPCHREPGHGGAHRHGPPPR